MSFKKNSFLIIFIGIVSFSYCKNVDLKPNLNLKLGLSFNRVFSVGDKILAFTTDSYTNGICSNEKYSLKPNLRIEANCFLTNWLELGFYGGYFEYYVFDVIIHNSIINVTQKKTYAPTFGLNCNFHLLKLLNYTKLKKLDLYYIFKYGGAILPKWGGEFEYPISNFYEDPIYSKFRSSYCFGIGGSYTIWKRIGLYSELTFGKHSYFPDIDLKSNIAFRGGIVFSI